MEVAIRIDSFDRRPEYCGVAGQKGCQLFALIRSITKSREIRAHLLEAEHVGIERLSGDGNDPRQIDHAVAAFSGNVPGEKSRNTVVSQRPF
jgi:hypothetical protein